MNKTLLIYKVKSLLTGLALSLALVSCSSESEEEEPVLMAAAPQQASFSLVDSIKVDPTFQHAYAHAFALNGKTYSMTANDQVEAFFQEDRQGVVLYFRAAANGVERPWVAFTFKDRAVNHLPTTLLAREAGVVCVEDGQNFADGSTVLSPGCNAVLDGTINLHYDPATDVISGSITNLKLPLEYYVPEYSFPNLESNVFKNSGSSRNLSISFKNVRRKK
ncbi:hypothetical protein [Rufibacter immobilis]|uniref:hypothetical protein n=1 Tax=Rufibacter immobilis TaxID=1348778 RepID=UPI0035ED2474